MDPGTALGAVSLLFQVFSGCIAAYQLASEAKGLEKSHGFVRVRFKTEQYRLLDWARVARLAENDHVFLTNASNRALVMEVLDQQYQHIMNFESIDDRLRLFSTDMSPFRGADDEKHATRDSSSMASDTRFPDSRELLQKALRLMETTRKLPKRLRWVVSDRAKMDGLLSRLTDLNDFLVDMLDAHLLQTLHNEQKYTNYQIIQLNTKMDQLLDIIQAGQISPKYDHSSIKDGSTDARIKNARLAHDLFTMAQFKATACAVEENSLSNVLRARIGIPFDSSNPHSNAVLAPEALDLDIPADMLSACFPRPRRVTGWFRPSKAPENRGRIWVEWRRIDSQQLGTLSAGQHAANTRRFGALVSLLREIRITAQFRAPQCLGYYTQQMPGLEPSYALVFAAPPALGASTSDLTPISLRDLIVDKDRSVPSLTARIRLMQVLAMSVEKLHVVGWLHKGLRSDNVIFFHDGSDDRDSHSYVDLADPYLTGFDYSRPAASVSMSEGPAADIWEDLYRHPNVQGLGGGTTPGRGFSKLHDIYSLGLILVEISHWKPLEAIIGVPDPAQLSIKDILNVRAVLLGRAHLQSAQSRMGDIVAGVIHTCLDGLKSGNYEGHLDQDGPDNEVCLQTTFSNTVVGPLGRLLV